jgi:uncharacterized protein
VKAERWVLAVAMLLPTVAAAIYFVGLSPSGNGVPETNHLLQVAYGISKLIQFSFPVFWLGLVDPAALGVRQISSRGTMTGIAFGLAVALLIWGLYGMDLADSTLFEGVAARIRVKLSEFGIATPARFLVLAGFLCVIHSLLEEYYWRWFVYGRLRRYVSQFPGLVVAGLAFMAHHVVVLWVYFPDRFWRAVLPFSLGIAVGGIFWAWLFERSRSLVGPWISHLIVDAALMAVGYDLLFGIR